MFSKRWIQSVAIGLACATPAFAQQPLPRQDTRGISVLADVNLFASEPVKEVAAVPQPVALSTLLIPAAAPILGESVPGQPVVVQPAPPIVTSPTSQLPPMTSSAQPAPVQGAPLVEGAFNGNANCNRFWFNAEYLLWWIKDAPLPVPLATVNSTGLGVLTNPNTRVIYGGESQDMGTFSGMRLEAGWWADDDHCRGAMIGGFFLQRNTQHFSFADPSGKANLSIPFFNDGFAFNVRNTNSEDAAIASRPNFRSGAIDASYFSQMYGMEANSLFNLRRTNAGELNLVAGLRYANLREGLAFYWAETNPLASVRDSWDTENDFYGAQVGFAGTYRHGAWSADMALKLALGWTHQAVDIGGVTDLTGTQFPVGFFNQRTNIGRFTRDQFAVLPELQLKLGYDLTCHFRATIGYDLLWWSDVLRPGDQIDRTVNLSGVAPYVTGARVGSPRPVPLTNDSQFWAQGLTFGLEFRW
jgi:hypothetical protein